MLFSDQADFRPKLNHQINSETEALKSSLELKSFQSENPWVEMAGELKDDPLFDAVLADIEDYRRAADKNK